MAQRIQQLNLHAQKHPSKDTLAFENSQIDYSSSLKGTLKVKDYYKGKSIFITGCTGFVAKVLLEKLMRSCPEISKFYLLVRTKKNIKPMERIKK